jgi:hypothetical protein
MAESVKGKPTKKVAPGKTKSTAKPKASVKPAKKSTAKASKAKPTIAPKAGKPVPVKKTRGPRKIKAIKGFEEIAKKQAELEAVTRKAKTGLKKEYEKAIKQAEAIKEQYRTIFHESIETASPKAARGGRRVRTNGAAAPFTKAEVESYIEQKENGITIDKIRIAGRRIKSIKRIENAYDQATDKNADSVLALLK